MYVGEDFDVMDPVESEVFTFNFARDMNHGATIESATWLCQVVTGTDALASSRMVGSASFSGTRTSQRVAAPVAGVRYRLQAIIVDSDENTKTLWSHFLCQSPT